MLWWLNLIFISWYLVLDVCDVITSSEPSDSFFLVLVLGPYARLHARLVQTRGLAEVEHVELDFVHLSVCMQDYVLVYYFEIVPLGVSSSIQIILQPEIVFHIVYLGSLPKIAIFKS